MLHFPSNTCLFLSVGESLLSYHHDMGYVRCRLWVSFQILKTRVVLQLVHRVSSRDTPRSGLGAQRNNLDAVWPVCRADTCIVWFHSCMVIARQLLLLLPPFFAHFPPVFALFLANFNLCWGSIASKPVSGMSGRYGKIYSGSVSLSVKYSTPHAGVR